MSDRTDRMLENQEYGAAKGAGMVNRNPGPPKRCAYCGSAKHSLPFCLAPGAQSYRAEKETRKHSDHASKAEGR